MVDRKELHDLLDAVLGANRLFHCVRMEVSNQYGESSVYLEVGPREGLHDFHINVVQERDSRMAMTYLESLRYKKEPQTGGAVRDSDT